MRLKDIENIRRRNADAIQPLPEGDFSASVGKLFTLKPNESLRQRLARIVARPMLAAQSHKARELTPTDTTLKVNYWTLEERYGNHACWAALMQKLPRLSKVDVLIPGCYAAGEEVQFWLRRSVKSLSGIDIYSLDALWDRIIPELVNFYQTPITFKQGSIEAIPYEDKQFDIIVSESVLEHVQNLNAMMEETFRVLKPGGYALHTFGPLYYSYGADHCIAAYGEAHAYDHLLLCETDYRVKIADQQVFQKAVGNPNLAFWAENDQFSFATASDYLNVLEQRFEIVYSVAKISQKGLSFRANHPKKWAALLASGIPESDLIIKGLGLLVRRPR